MSGKLEDLLDLLDLELVGEDVYLGQSQDLGWGTVFGGQVLGQALSAAARSVVPERYVHSFHSYFLRAGDPSRPILYRVERTRDGGSFSTRRIRAEQHDRPIFFMAASFHISEPGLDHQAEMPAVPMPEELPTLSELADRLKGQIPNAIRERLQIGRPIEMRPVQVTHPLSPEPDDPHRQVWMRVEEALPDDPAVHRYLLAYVSDFYLLGTALAPHGRSFWQGTTQMASIDHAMWFHRELRLDDWLLYAMDSPTACGARGLVRGQFFDRQGRLVASTAQEGLLRPLDRADGTARRPTAPSSSS